ncbi:MAG: outer membrane beta-barrel domain-containing protein [Steroidobacteraceae bacterium]
MEARTRVLLLALISLPLAGCASLHLPWHKTQAAAEGAEASPPVTSAPVTSAPIEAQPDSSDNAAPRVIDPVVERRKIKVPKIDTENIEIGAYYGELSIEDFGASPYSGLRFRYHVTEDFFFEASLARATAGKTSFETLGGNIQLLTDDERKLTHYSLSLGYNFLPGEIFIGRNRAMTSTLYLLGGIGSVKFAGDQYFSINFGTGFQVLPTDWLALHIEMQDVVFNSDLLGVNKLKNNLQAQIGASVFF